MDDLTFTLNSPLTEAEWDMIEDVDFDHTDKITFHTKHAKEVEFVKRKTGRWINGKCNQCGGHAPFWPMASTYYLSDFCPECGAKMEVEHE